jgi:hypothetical protein
MTNETGPDRRSFSKRLAGIAGAGLLMTEASASGQDRPAQAAAEPPKRTLRMKITLPQQNLWGDFGSGSRPKL